MTIADLRFGDKFKVADDGRTFKKAYVGHEEGRCVVMYTGDEVNFSPDTEVVAHWEQ